MRTRRRRNEKSVHSIKIVYFSLATNRESAGDCSRSVLPTKGAQRLPRPLAPPRKKNTHPEDCSECVFFVCKDYFGLKVKLK